MIEDSMECSRESSEVVDRRVATETLILRFKKGKKEKIKGLEPIVRNIILLYQARIPRRKILFCFSMRGLLVAYLSFHFPIKMESLLLLTTIIYLVNYLIASTIPTLFRYVTYSNLSLSLPFLVLTRAHISFTMNPLEPIRIGDFTRLNIIIVERITFKRETQQDSSM